MVESTEKNVFASLLFADERGSILERHSIHLSSYFWVDSSPNELSRVHIVESVSQ
jgi:hypothetical protein